MHKDMTALIDELCDAAKLVKKEVGKIVQKSDLTPPELESLCKAAGFAEKMASICMEDDRELSYGHYDHYDDMHGYSERRGQSPVTGRYISRGMSGMSGHSVEDRTIALLEEQMDKAKSDYERDFIRGEIEHIRRGGR